MNNIKTVPIIMYMFGLVSFTVLLMLAVSRNDTFGIIGFSFVDGFAAALLLVVGTDRSGNEKI